MTSAFNSDDTFNVIEEHIKQTLAADTKFAAGGTLEIKTFEQEHREDASSYGENELPAISIEVGVQSQEEVAIGDLVEYQYLAHILIVTTGGQTQKLLQTELKYYAARATRILQQQHYPTKQLTSIADDLDGADAQGTKVVVQSATVNVGATERNPNVLRGLAEIFAVVSVTITLPED
tara:strand:+ start:2371 stop:2904 length:534 start_codon:yes stop_codon:yes gene_type:complete